MITERQRTVSSELQSFQKNGHNKKKRKLQKFKYFILSKRLYFLQREYIQRLIVDFHTQNFISFEITPLET